MHDLTELVWDNASLQITAANAHNGYSTQERKKSCLTFVLETIANCLPPKNVFKVAKNVFQVAQNFF
jgi:hypothetical protein